MSEIQISLDRVESYALLAATEFVRHLFGKSDGEDEEGGIPLTSSIQFPLTSRRYARVDVTFKIGDSGYIAKVFVALGVAWPKEGHVALTQIDTVAENLIYSLKLNGHPGKPVVEFSYMETVPHGELGDSLDSVSCL